MEEPPIEVTYTVADLREIARARGLPDVKPRTITDWVEVGLLDQPRHRGAGKTKGSTPGRWPHNQAQLYFVLLGHKARQPTITLASLCCLPVSLWLDWGDDYAPIRQVRRALDTYAKNRARSQLRGEDLAWDIALQIADPRAADIDLVDLAAVIAEMNRSGDVTAHSDRLTDLTARVVDPRGEGRQLGVPGLQMGVDTLAVMARWAEAGRRAVRRDRVGGERSGRYQVTEAMYNEVRVGYRAATASYVADRQRLAEHNPEFFPELTDERRVTGSCRNLLWGIGARLEAPPGPDTAR